MENPKLFDLHEELLTPDGQQRGFFPVTSITLRDLFAGLAMHATLTRHGLNLIEGATHERQLQELGRSSYEEADAMLKAREVSP